MKKKNAICEFSKQRSLCLLNNFRESIARQSKISLQRAFKDAVEAPTPRFWVSEARAARVITLLMKSDEILEGMRSEKQEMFREIFKRVRAMLKEKPDAPIGDLVFEVVNNPAPRTYLNWKTVAKYLRRDKYIRS